MDLELLDFSNSNPEPNYEKSSPTILGVYYDKGEYSQHYINHPKEVLFNLEIIREALLSSDISHRSKGVVNTAKGWYSINHALHSITLEKAKPNKENMIVTFLIADDEKLLDSFKGLLGSCIE